MAEENASLILELDSGPTVKQFRSLQRQLEILERRTASARQQSEEAGAAAENGELDLSIKTLGNSLGAGSLSSSKISPKDNPKSDF